MDHPLLNKAGSVAEESHRNVPSSKAKKANGWGKLKAVGHTLVKEKKKSRTFRRRLRIRLVSRIGAIFVASSFDETLSNIISVALAQPLNREDFNELMSDTIAALAIFVVCLLVNVGVIRRLNQHRKSMKEDGELRLRLSPQSQTLVGLAGNMASIISSWNAQKALTNMFNQWLGTSVTSQLAAFVMTTAACLGTLAVIMHCLNRHHMMTTNGLSSEAESATTYMCLMVSLSWCNFLTQLMLELGGTVAKQPDTSHLSQLYGCLFLWGFTVLSFVVLFALTTCVVKFKQNFPLFRN